MTPATLDLPEVVEGDTWAGLGAFSIRDINETTQEEEIPEGNIVSAVIHFSRTMDQPTPDLSLTAGTTTGFTVDSAANWDLTCGEMLLPGLTGGEYFQKLVITDDVPRRLTRWIGKIRVLNAPPGT